MAILAALMTLFVGGLFFAGIQQIYYTIQVRRGRLPADEVPFFGLLLFRGLAIMFLLSLAGAITAHLLQGPVKG